MKTILIIKTVTGFKFEVEGTNHKHIDNIHYLNGESYPDEIVEKVKVEK